MPLNVFVVGIVSVMRAVPSKYRVRAASGGRVTQSLGRCAIKGIGGFVRQASHLHPSGQNGKQNEAKTLCLCGFLVIMVLDDLTGEFAAVGKHRPRRLTLTR